MNNSEILMLKSAGFTQAQISSHKQKFKNLMRLAPSLLIDECESLRARVAELEREKNEAIMKTGTFDESKWKLVPVEPTKEMLKVGFERGAAGEYNEGIYRAMLQAAPDHPEAGESRLEIEALALDFAAYICSAVGNFGDGFRCAEELRTRAEKKRKLAAEKRAKESE